VGRNTLSIDQYAAVARSTAIYPEAASFIYPALGLCGEIGELSDYFLPIEGDKVRIPENNIIAELGDVLWYVTNVALDLGFSLKTIAHQITDGLPCDTFGALAFARLKRRDNRSPFLKLAIYSAQIAEVAKKGLRDGWGLNLTVAKRALVVAALAEILVSLCEICEKYKISIDEVAFRNNKKLTDRQSRGKLQGDGDQR